MLYLILVAIICLNPIHALSLSAYMAVNLFFSTIVAGTWHTLDTEIDPASNTGKIPTLAFSFPARMLASIFAFIF